jgi:hypothetical protein
VSNNRNQNCYLCGIEVREYKLKPGEQHPSDQLIPDHVPPKGLFPEPRPDNLIEVPCCFSCNNKHSGFDERLRIVAVMAFDRNKIGQKILDEKVIGSTMEKGRQMEFIKKILATMQPVRDQPGLIHAKIEAQEFKEGMIQITKGLLFTLHPTFNYRGSNFRVESVHPRSSDEQLRLMAMLKQGEYFQRGSGVFQCWRCVDESKGGGAWMLVLYDCFAFFVFHTNDSRLDNW